MPLDLQKIAASTTNLAEELEDDKLSKIGQRCLLEFSLDEESRSAWRDSVEKSMELAKQVMTKKTTPWPGASNVKYPLIAGAAIQFAARAYPEIVKGTEIVKGKVVGQDPGGEKEARALRVGRHMSYQILEEMDEWESEMDKLLHLLPILGTVYKKTYWNTVFDRPCSEMCSPFDVVVHDKAKNLATCRRTSHIISLYKNDIRERIASGQWLKDSKLTLVPKDTDEQGPFSFVEQHRWLDLDGDDYEEPFVVTYEKDTGLVVRIVPRFEPQNIRLSSRGKVTGIEAEQYFSKFGFIPSLDSYYDIGFGQLLYPLNEAINTTVNQLVDAGTLQNMQGGFISKQLRLKGGELRLKPGEWKEVNALSNDLRGSIIPIPYKEPAMVLFQLLGLMKDAGDRLSSVSEVLTGEQSGTNVPATTTLALIEQGLKVFSSINKRLYRSLKDEFKILARLNHTYLSDAEYFRVLDEENIVSKHDYDSSNLDIVPVADPTSASDTQRMIRAEALLKTIGAPGGGDPYEIMHEYYQSLKVPDDILQKMHPMPPPQPQPPPPDPKLVEIQVNQDLALRKLPFEIEVLRTEAILNVAKAEAAELGPEMEQYAQDLKALMNKNATAADFAKQQQKVEQDKAELDQTHQHQAQLQADQQQHEAAMEAMSQGGQAMQQGADQAHQQGMQDAAQGHEAELQDAQQAHEQELAAQQGPPDASNQG